MFIHCQISQSIEQPSMYTWFNLNMLTYRHCFVLRSQWELIQSSAGQLVLLSGSYRLLFNRSQYFSNNLNHRWQRLASLEINLADLYFRSGQHHLNDLSDQKWIHLCFDSCAQSTNLTQLVRLPEVLHCKKGRSLQHTVAVLTIRLAGGSRQGNVFTLPLEETSQS